MLTFWFFRGREDIFDDESPLCRFLNELDISHLSTDWNFLDHDLHDWSIFLKIGRRKKILQNGDLLIFDDDRPYKDLYWLKDYNEK